MTTLEGYETEAPGQTESFDVGSPVHLKRLESAAVPKMFENMLMSQIKKNMVSNMTNNTTLRKITEVGPNNRMQRFHNETNLPMNI